MGAFGMRLGVDDSYMYSRKSGLVVLDEFASLGTK